MQMQACIFEQITRALLRLRLAAAPDKSWAPSPPPIFDGRRAAASSAAAAADN